MEEVICDLECSIWDAGCMPGTETVVCACGRGKKLPRSRKRDWIRGAVSFSAVKSDRILKQEKRL